MSIGVAAAEQILEQIDFVVGVHALHDSRYTLQPHAGIDRGLRQWIEGALGIALELHEDEVPDLDVAITILQDFQVATHTSGP